MKYVTNLLVTSLTLAGACAAGAAHADERSANLVTGPRVDFTSCAKPVWPPASLAAHHTGKVTLGFLVGADGTVEDSKIIKSSGHPALDEAARDGIAKCRFKPAQPAGQLLKGWTRLQYVWTLE